MSDKLEFYRTPAWVIEELWDAVPQLHPDEAPAILDPCCGDGAILKAYDTCGKGRCDIGIDVDQTKATETKRLLPDATVFGNDFLAAPHAARLVSAVVMNPPFSRAFAFWRHAIERAPCVAMLAPLAMVLPKRDRKLIGDPRYRPNIIVYLSRRPSFTGDGRTDMRDVCWYVWHRWSSTCEARWPRIKGGDR